MGTEQELFLRRFQKLSPLLAKTIAEHEEYYDEVIPHILCGEITKVIVELFLANDTAAKRAIELVNEEYPKACDDVKNIIVFSMLENLPSTGETGVEITKYLSQDLIVQYRIVNH